MLDPHTLLVQHQGCMRDVPGAGDAHELDLGGGDRWPPETTVHQEPSLIAGQLPGTPRGDPRGPPCSGNEEPRRPGSPRRCSRRRWRAVRDARKPRPSLGYTCAKFEVNMSEGVTARDKTLTGLARGSDARGSTGSTTRRRAASSSTSETMPTTSAGRRATLIDSQPGRRLADITLRSGWSRRPIRTRVARWGLPSAAPAART